MTREEAVLCHDDEVREETTARLYHADLSVRYPDQPARQRRIHSELALASVPRQHCLAKSDVNFRPHRMHARTDAAYCYTCRTFRGLRASVYACVGHTGEPCKPAEVAEMPFKKIDSRVCKDLCIRPGHGKGHLWGDTYPPVLMHLRMTEGVACLFACPAASAADQCICCREKRQNTTMRLFVKLPRTLVLLKLTARVVAS